jgi:hypothetical protein
MPVAGLAISMAVLASVLTQQHLTVAANGPQVKTAEYAVARLESGTNARSVVPAKAIDRVSTLDLYLVVFGRSRHFSAALQGRIRTSRPASCAACLPKRRT